MLLRQVRDTRDDASAVRTVAAAAFAASHAAKGDAPEEWWSPEAIAGHERTTRHLARTDPGGCWLAEDAAGRPVGAVRASLREGTWGLSLLAVLPEAQGNGVGTALLDRALEYGRGTLRGIICGSRHPVAARTYRRAGFTLHPAMRMRGTVDATRLPAPDGPALEGSAAHRDLMDSVDRRIRGGAHGPDHLELLRHHRVVVADDLAGGGYAYVSDDGRVELLAATSRRIATRLLTAALLSLPAGATARLAQLTAEQEWAVDVGLAAGLELTTAGYLCLRGMRPPTPYIPSGTFL
ncbi:GNAT family N-acetyltransferase [Streptomyces sp. ACA25]|uniref:GNAT family N-acetyltransferase n=1 Tax=Streptomyces sp. ACA25 TaxID=3022596 RepID=UPI00230812F2|nr:GNAT family N-acetyltransferase [Streptomyces sp. ACA25]MDB1089932.1 GNAT family N-acetyltransferase [Streptomyces sp. ACA25]